MGLSSQFRRVNAVGVMMRVALGIEYVGTDFHGWQSQEDTYTVQGCVEAALSQVANHPVQVICAGRTDTGVHALSQVIHMDVTAERSMRAWVFGANANLPKTISVLWAQPVDSAFHARFSALARHYRYVILTRTIRPAVLAKRVTWSYRQLDVARMQQAGNYLIGTHDFSAYRAVACQAKSPVRTLHSLQVSAHSAELIVLDICANAFLQHMVRNIAGVLMTIGSGEQPPEWAQTVLQARDRTLGGVTAPAYGLYFVGVDYPDPYRFPKVTRDLF